MISWIILALVVMVAAHFLGDYFLQIFLQKFLRLFGIKYTKFGSWQIWAHCGLYLLPFIPIFWFFEIAWLWLIFLFLSHLIVDSQIQKLKVRKSYQDMSYLKRLLKLDLGLIADQGLHLASILIVFILWIIL